MSVRARVNAKMIIIALTNAYSIARRNLNIATVYNSQQHIVPKKTVTNRIVPLCVQNTLSSNYHTRYKARVKNTSIYKLDRSRVRLKN